MESYGIDNSQISASSVIISNETEKFGPQSARLHNKFAWRAKQNATTGEFLQVDFGEIKTLTAIATQGDKSASAWVLSFTIKYSLDNETWEASTQVNVAILILLSF